MYIGIILSTPYLQAMDRFLEVRVAETCELVQQLPIARVQALCHYHGWMYAATAPAATPSSQLDLGNSDNLPDALRSPGFSEPSETPGRKSMGSGNEIWLILSANRMNLVEQLIRRQVHKLVLLFNCKRFFIQRQHSVFSFQTQTYSFVYADDIRYLLSLKLQRNKYLTEKYA